METITFNLPIMYGDHHVVEVRKLILSIPGVEDIYASSCFQVVEVTYDESKTNAAAIEEQLEKGGYLGDMSFPVEAGTDTAASNGKKAFFRHTAVLEQAGDVVSFAQKAPYAGRPLWPCPGVGPMQDIE